MMSHSFDDAVTIPSAVKASLLREDHHDLIVQQPVNANTIYHNAPEIDLDQYSKILVFISSGKDSWACLLQLMELGCDMSKVELVHHCVDGHFNEPHFADWSYVTDYCRKLASHFQLPIYYSWLEKGFRGELLKENSRPQNHVIQTPSGWLNLDRPRAKEGTRMRFPQQTANLKTRWCSGELKTTVGNRLITNQKRFLGGTSNRILVVVGQRRLESSARAKLAQYVIHSTDTARNSNPQIFRYVDEWRPILSWTEEQVWTLLEKYGVNPPVAYRLGWGRSSCATCIFNSPQLWATLRHYFPRRFELIANLEQSFGVSISQKKIFLKDLTRGVAPLEINDYEALEQAYKSEYTLPIVTNDWQLPAGAFSVESAGAI
ncbi:phosphoadenosine phosphosulfate reductase family protein [Vibrio harveyi]|uniref:phosphoadenosine phosphosulfate reductase domain-containing protein n=1 Tax=Vibrio harveyi TaxID=669 RepID=UPI0024819542|nr:phosphoadenosine phosphosulfate reductase family protein [Vibrio harveyi]